MVPLSTLLVPAPPSLYSVALVRATCLLRTLAACQMPKVAPGATLIVFDGSPMPMVYWNPRVPSFTKISPTPMSPSSCIQMSLVPIFVSAWPLPMK